MPLHFKIPLSDEKLHAFLPSNHRYQISQKSCVKSQHLSYQNVKKEIAVKRVRIANPDKSDKVNEPKDEYIQPFTTPKTTPEPSHIKKNIKENLTEKVDTLKNRK